jgi:hypothetical protein
LPDQQLQDERKTASAFHSPGVYLQDTLPRCPQIRGFDGGGA